MVVNLQFSVDRHVYMCVRETDKFPKADFGGTSQLMALLWWLRRWRISCGAGSCGSSALKQDSAACSVTLWRVVSYRTRDQTRVSCFGRWILYHWADRKALFFSLMTMYKLLRKFDGVDMFVRSLSPSHTEAHHCHLYWKSFFSIF